MTFMALVFIIIILMYIIFFELQFLHKAICWCKEGNQTELSTEQSRFSAASA